MPRTPLTTHGQQNLYPPPVPHRLILGDCRQAMAAMPSASVDAIVTDPPYELGFMGRAWDASGIAYDVGVWSQALRVLKPGGHLLAFGGTRTWHRLACAVEDAGFEMRDSVAAWLYGQGFPKSHDVGKAVDAHLGAERAPRRVPGREVRNHKATGGGGADSPEGGVRPVVLRAREAGYTETPGPVPATAEGAVWDGWGTGLKPAWEPVVVARRPLSGTIAANVLAHGTGALNVDGCRVGTTGGTKGVGPPSYQNEIFGEGMGGCAHDPDFVAGRWPTNVVFAHHPDCIDAPEPRCHPACWVLGLETGSEGRGRSTSPAGIHGILEEAWPGGSVYGGGLGIPKKAGMPVSFGYGDRGGPSRFFPVFRYTAKAPTSERVRTDEGHAHETVKPLDLIRWLVRLVTPPGGTVYDPFGGSGTLLEAGHMEGMAVTLSELKFRYADLTRKRAARCGTDVEVTSVRRLTLAGG